MKKALPFLICFFFIISFTIFKSETNAEVNKTEIIINENNVNIRAEPNLNSAVLKQSSKGEVYELISRESDWIKIKMSNDKNGWVASWLVNEVEEEHNKDKTYIAIVTTDDLHVRKGPGINEEVVTHLQRNDIVDVLELKGDWAKIKGRFGTGWITTQFTKLYNKDSTSDETIYYGVVTTNILNIRETPSEDAKVIGKIQEKDEITIINEQNNWYEIIFGQSTGWINKLYVERVSNNKLTNDEHNDKIPDKLKGFIGKITASSLNVRKKDSFNSKIVGTVSIGNYFEIVEEKNNWIKIEYAKGKFGWVSSWFIEKKTNGINEKQQRKNFKKSNLTVIYNDTNIRKEPNSHSKIIRQAKEGERFNIVRQHGDWYEIKLPKRETGFIAGWLVNTNGIKNTIKKAGPEQYLKNKTIVLDPGHGGYDQGSAGSLGNIEKQLTLKTAYQIANKLQQSGARVILTRTADTYISLPTRISMTNYYNADAFLSIHFDSIEDTSISGMTTYYYYNFQKELADNVHSSLVNSTNLKNRGTQFGDYYVLRENFNDAILLELGFLSNPSEETYIATTQFRNAVSNGIYEGLAKYFKVN